MVGTVKKCLKKTQSCLSVVGKKIGNSFGRQIWPYIKMGRTFAESDFIVVAFDKR